MQEERSHLEGDLKLARSQQPWTPEAHHFQALEERVVAMEQAAAYKERQWRSLLEQAQALAGAQAQMQQQRVEVALQVCSVRRCVFCIAL